MRTPGGRWNSLFLYRIETFAYGDSKAIVESSLESWPLMPFCGPDMHVYSSYFYYEISKLDFVGRCSKVSSSSLAISLSSNFCAYLMQLATFTTWTAFSPALKIIPVLNLTSRLYFNIVKFDDDKHTKLNGRIASFVTSFSSSSSITMNCLRDTYLFFILMSESTEDPKIIVGACLMLAFFPSIIVSSPLSSNTSPFLRSV